MWPKSSFYYQAYILWHEPIGRYFCWAVNDKGLSGSKHTVPHNYEGKGGIDQACHYYSQEVKTETNSEAYLKSSGVKDVVGRYVDHEEGQEGKDTSKVNYLLRVVVDLCELAFEGNDYVVHQPIDDHHGTAYNQHHPPVTGLLVLSRLVQSFGEVVFLSLS